MIVAADKSGNLTSELIIIASSRIIATQAVKPFVIQRKVFQTSKSYADARNTTKLFFIVQTCKINNINVERYFDCVLKNINNEQIENLLPYSSKIKNKIG